MKNHCPFQNNDPGGGRDAAVKLIRERIRALYGNQPIVQPREKTSLVDRFWEDHKDHPDPQSAWHEFYAGLTDDEKHSLWNEYHTSNSPVKSGESKVENIEAKAVAKTDLGTELSNDSAHAFSFEATRKSKRDKIKDLKQLKDKDNLSRTKQKLIENVKSVPRRREKKQQLNRKKSNNHWRPLIISLSVMLVWLAAQYNPLVIAFAKQYVSPGDTLRSPVIVDPNASIQISDESRIIIPKINVDVPVVYDERTRDEAAIQDALERGVVHYAGTNVPGESGNNVIVGHSSNNFLNSGKYKFAFVLLDRLELNDTFILHYEGTRYVYKVTNKQVIEPTDFSLTLPTTNPTVTLITCTPPGTSWRRLVIQAEQISPTVTAAQLENSDSIEEVIETPPDTIVPGNAPSFWQRLSDWIF